MIQLNCAVLPEAIRASNNAFILIKIYNADGIDICASETISRSILAGGTVYVTRLTSKCTVGCILSVRTNCHTIVRSV